MQHNIKMVSGQLPPEENWHPARVGVLVKVSVSFRVRGYPDNCPGRKLLHWLGLGFGLGLVLGLGGGGNFPRGKLSRPHKNGACSRLIY